MLAAWSKSLMIMGAAIALAWSSLNIEKLIAL